MTRVDANLASLCLAVLDGEADLNLILADYFEESGNSKAEAFRALQSALSLNGCRFTHKIKDPLDLVLHAMSEETCWLLMCDFAEHVLWVWDEANPNSPQPRGAIAARRDWLKGEITAEELEAVRISAWEESRTESGYLMRAARAACRAGGGDSRAAAWAAAADALGVIKEVTVQRRHRLNRDEFQFRSASELNAALAADTVAYQKAVQEALETERQWQINQVRYYLLTACS